MTSGERSIFFLLPMINTHTYMHTHSETHKSTHELQACLKTTLSALMPASFCPVLSTPLQSIYFLLQTGFYKET